MKRAQLIVAGLAVVAGVGAFMLSGSKPKTVVVQSAPVVQKQEIPSEQILVVTKDIPVGGLIDEKVLSWKPWPKDSIGKLYITKSANPKALDEYKKAIARYPLISGEPITPARVAKTDSGGVMAALLPKGMRAIAVAISAETSAGGFILPNDRVDVMLTRRERATSSSAKDNIITERVLPNVRVLAIDQTIQEKDGEKVVVGRTATLELSPKQVETLSRAKQMAASGGEILLALRSLADNEKSDDDVAENPRHEEDSTVMTVVRFGMQSQVPVSK